VSEYDLQIVVRLETCVTGLRSARRAAYRLVPMCKGPFANFRQG